MSLSPRAQAYLTTLKRASYPSVDEVAEAIKRAQCPVFDAWLDFHASFGGYEEVIGRDTAIWGLVHSEPRWLSPMEASVKPLGDIWRIRCADAYPSYDYWLDSNGEFVSLGGGAACETFFIKVERDAVLWETTIGNRTWRLDSDILRAAEGIDNLLHSVEMETIPEASDKYLTCWRGRDVIVIEDPEDQEASSVWVATDARERVVSQVTSVN